MNEYLLSVIGTVLLCAVLTAIVPDGKASNTIRGITKLACLLVIFSPILKFFQNGSIYKSEENYEEIFFDSVIETDEDFIKYYSETNVRYVEDVIEKELFEKYSVNASVVLEWQYVSEMYINLFETQKIQITQICVATETELNEEEKTVVWDYLTKNYCSEVLIE